MKQWVELEEVVQLLEAFQVAKILSPSFYNEMELKSETGVVVTPEMLARIEGLSRPFATTKNLPKELDTNEVRYGWFSAMVRVLTIIRGEGNGTFTADGEKFE